MASWTRAAPRGAGAEMDIELFHDTGRPSKKVFMLPDKTKIPATKIMRLKHNLRPGAGEMNIVSNLHSTLISVPKMAEHGYIAVFDKKEARIYDGTTTMITASGEPIIVAPRCDNTGLWRMNLDMDYEILGRTSSDQFIAGVDVANAIFRFTQLSAIAHVFPRGGRISNKRIIHGCSPSRQLRDVAGSHNHAQL